MDLSNLTEWKKHRTFFSEGKRGGGRHGWLLVIAFCVCMPLNVFAADTPQVSDRIEPAFAAQERVGVLIKLKEADEDQSGRLSGRAMIKSAQNRFSERLAGEGLTDDVAVSRRMHLIPWLSANITRKAFERLRRHSLVAVIEADIPISAQLTESAPLVKGDRSYATGYTGSGVNVAVLDTGIDTDHPDLADSVVWEECFLTDAPCPVTGTDRASGPGSAEDNEGHGSHVAGIITSDNEIYRGVAPEAGIVAIKILDNSGNGTISDLIAALDWVAGNHYTYDIRVLNMSLGSFGYEGVCDSQNQSMAEAADAVKAAGVALFAASGNDGADYRIDVPACLSSVFSVGAVYDADAGGRTYNNCTDEVTAADIIACFSNVSTVLDLLAPGARITSTNRFGGTSTHDGTSQACPHAAGMAALLLEANPSLTPEELLTVMTTTGTPLFDGRIDMSFPRIDIAAALGIDVAAEPFKYDFDYVTPGEGSTPKLFTVFNTGSDDIQLGSLFLSGDHPSDFRIVADDCSEELLSGSGGACSFSIQFSPTAAGTRTGRVQIPTDEPEAPELSIEVKGWSGQAYFVNDASTDHDIWCSAVGSDVNSGLSGDAPKATVQSVLADYDLEPGDVVRIDTGLYPLDSNIEVQAEDGGDSDYPVAFTASPYGVMFDRGDQTVLNSPWFFNECEYISLTTIDVDTCPDAQKTWMEIVGGYDGIYLLDAYHISLSRLSIHRNGRRGIYANRSHYGTFTHNLIFDNPSYGLSLGAADYGIILNNTVIGSNASAIRLDGSSNHAVLKNNILLAEGSGQRCLYASDYASIDASDYNLFLPSGGATLGYYDEWAEDLGEWQALTGLDAYSVSIDPGFKDPLLYDYHLMAGSPVIDAGDPASDYSQEPLPNGGRINMGAYGGTSLASTSLAADLDADGDVDGRDLFLLISLSAYDKIPDLAATFGR